MGFEEYVFYWVQSLVNILWVLGEANKKLGMNL